MRITGFLIALFWVQACLLPGRLAFAQEFSSAYATWATEHYDAISQHSVGFEILLHDLKRETNTDKALSAIAQAKSLGLSREEFELLVTSTHDAVVTPLLKRLLLGAYFLAPDDHVRAAALEFFVQYDAHIKKLSEPGLTPRDKRLTYQMISSDLLFFQKALDLWIRDGHERTRYLKSLARVMVSDDREVLRWTEKALKQKLPYPRYPYSWMMSFKQNPLRYVLYTLEGGLVVAGFYYLYIAGGPPHPFLGLAGFVAGVHLYWQSGPYQNKVKGMWWNTKQGVEKREQIRLERKAMLKFMQPDCDEVFLGAQ